MERMDSFLTIQKSLESSLRTGFTVFQIMQRHQRKKMNSQKASKSFNHSDGKRIGIMSCYPMLDEHELMRKSI